MIYFQNHTKNQIIMSNSNITAKKAAELICSWDNILILIHAKPDGDAVGSGFALLGILTELGKNARLICADRLAEKFNCVSSLNFPEKAIFCNDSEKTAEFLADFTPEHVISSDIAAPYLLGNNEAAFADKIELCIDHHEINTISAKYYHVVPEASAAGEVISDIADEMSALVGKEVITVGAASALYCAIASDSGSFRYANATSKAYRTAAKLKDAGADSEIICRNLFESRTLPSYKVCARVMNNTKLYFDGKLSFSVIRQSELAECGADDSDVEGAVGVVREIAGVEVGILARENASGLCKISMRSNCDINVAEICRSFGGGGHAKAAGCSLEGGFDNAVKAVIAKMAETFGDQA